MIAPCNEEGGGAAALLERARERRKEMAEVRRSLDALRAGVREMQAQSWRINPEETGRRTKELSQATEKECALSRELIRCGRELVETTRQILEMRRAEREKRPNDVPEPPAP